MAHRSHARWLAPIALLAAFAAVGLVVQSTTEDGSKPSSSTREGGEKGSTSTTRRTTTARPTQEGSAGPRNYTVKSGDTLGGIAEKTGVSVTALQELNPELDAQSLSVGQRIRLRR